jgi:hypothetical protein
VIGEYRHFRTTVAEVGEALSQVSAPARVTGGLADDPKGADLLRGEWGGKLDKSLLIRTARDIAENLVARLPETPQALPVPQPQPGRRHSAVLAPDSEPDSEPEMSPAAWATRGYPPVSQAGPAGAVTHDGP